MNLHEIKNEISKKCNSVFEMVGTMVVVENIRKTTIRFRNIEEFETYKYSLAENGYESEDDFFTA